MVIHHRMVLQFHSWFLLRWNIDYSCAAMHAFDTLIGSLNRIAEKGSKHKYGEKCVNTYLCVFNKETFVLLFIQMIQTN